MTLASLLALSLVSGLGAADYYLSADGDDAATGTSPTTAWRSLDRLLRVALQPGDRILLRGGDHFHGRIFLAASGTEAKPLTVASWGEGRASIHAHAGQDGILAIDVSHLVIRDLDIRGPGVNEAKKGSGIFLYATKAKNRGIIIRDVEASDFPAHGIQLWCDDGTVAGFSDVLVERVACHGSGEGGMGSWDPCKPGVYSYQRITVRDSVFYGNRGRVDKTDNHSGNGIILGGCQDSLIERCAAWANGDLCRSKKGGPVGIWLCESDRSVIRACVSFRNRTGAGVPDGGGFDLDGGCSDCVIEDCLSWRNDGAGYLICQYQGARPLRGSVVRNCFSIGDGLGHNNGGIYTYAAPGDAIHGLFVEACTVVVDPTPSKASALRLQCDVTDAKVTKSLFIALGGARLRSGVRTPGFTYAGNQWWSVDGTPVLTEAKDGVMAIPADDRVTDPGIDLSGGIPVHVDEAWLRRFAETTVGAKPLPRYGPALLPE